MGVLCINHPPFFGNFWLLIFKYVYIQSLKGKEGWFHLPSQTQDFETHVYSIQEAVHSDFYCLKRKSDFKWLRFGISNQGCGCFLVGRCLAGIYISHKTTGGSCNIQRASWHNCMVFNGWGYYRIAGHHLPQWSFPFLRVRAMPVTAITHLLPPDLCNCESKCL